MEAYIKDMEANQEKTEATAEHCKWVQCTEATREWAPAFYADIRATEDRFGDQQLKPWTKNDKWCIPTGVCQHHQKK
jgi:hypothetical protein